MGVPHYAFEYSGNYEEALRRAAAECGVDLNYWDIFHHQHHASTDALRSILSAQGWNVSSAETINSERLYRFEQHLTRPLLHTSVLSHASKSVELTLPSFVQGNLCFTVAMEDGNHLSGSSELHQLEALRELSTSNHHARVYRLQLLAELPLGYHQLTLTLHNERLAVANIVVCPDRAYLPDHLCHGGKTAGFNVTLYGLVSDRNWGCGDFTDLKALIDWAHQEVGFSFIGLNPLHALHNRVPYNTSPYLPLCVYYKNQIYVDVEQVPEFAQSRWAQAFFHSGKVRSRIASLRQSEFVNYHEVDTLKHRFLKMLYRDFRRQPHTPRAEAFRRYCAEEGDLLHKYALYRALDEILHKQDRNRWTWLDWPTEFHTTDSDACRVFESHYRRTIEYYKFVQFVIEEQLASAQAHAKEIGMSIGLYHDLAVATDSCGADLWAHRSFYMHGCRVGAPPDDFSPKGQDWGFPPPNSQAHRADGYRLFRESIRKIVKSGGALRLDHVMRLFRLFWIPEGLEAAQGTYVRDTATDLMRILALESVRSRNIIIGEDLGTVTDEIRDSLGSFGILSYRLFYFEKNRDGSFIPSRAYPQQALVSSTTHDLATLAGFWQYRDIEARRAAGLADENGYWQQRRDRDGEKQCMLDILHQEQLVPDNSERNASNLAELTGELHNGAIGFLAQVPSLILLLNQEDLTKETEQQNLPGSTAQYPNWQRKMRVKVEDLRSPAVAPFAQMMRNQLARTQRN